MSVPYALMAAIGCVMYSCSPHDDVWGAGDLPGRDPGNTIVFSDPYLFVRPPSVPGAHEGSGGCQFPNHSGPYCPDCAPG